MYISTSAEKGIIVAFPLTASTFQIFPSHVVRMADASGSHAGCGITPRLAARWLASCWTSMRSTFSSPLSMSRSMSAVRAS
jgi:hypothetical protein